MSRYVLLEPVRWVFIFLDYAGYTGGLGRFLGDILMDLGMMRPASRRQESEADYIGLMMMARSCYNPDEAVKVWERMEKFQKAAGNPSVSVSERNKVRLLTARRTRPG
jgi:Zn-dependent protease with chaperone function